MTLSALVLTGTGRYADPWHPFDRTTPLIVEVLDDLGIAATVAPDTDRALASRARSAAAFPDLLVVNLGRPTDSGRSPAAGDATAGLRRMLRAVPVLAFHASANAFSDSPEWEDAIGARWLPGTSRHPPLSLTDVRSVAADDRLPRLRGFRVADERYLELRRPPGARVLLDVDDDAGGRSPALWTARTTAPRSAYDALGHDERSFREPGHRDAIATVVRWLVDVGVAREE